MLRTTSFFIVFLALLSLANVAFAEEAAPIEQLKELVSKSPETFEITLRSHYSDDDFGFHIQTASLSRDDSLYPRYRITGDQAVQVVRELAATSFAENVEQGERNAKFLPAKPMPVGKRVYSVVVRCGDFAFFEDVPSNEEMKKRGQAVGDAFRGLKIGSSFQASFNSKLK